MAKMAAKKKAAKKPAAAAASKEENEVENVDVMDTVENGEATENGAAAENAQPKPKAKRAQANGVQKAKNTSEYYIVNRCASFSPIFFLRIIKTKPTKL